KPKKTRKKKEIIEEVEEPKPISVTPILSVIGTVNSDAVELAGESVTVLDAEDAETCASSTEIIIDDFGADSDDAIKSIEDIFADIAPIAEDRPVNLAEYDDATDTKSADADQLDIDLDATLSKLATEFAASQDEGAPATRSPEGAKGGKIGKLKNILPFKKKERSEGSVLGDLFGWAGVAANDDAADFAIPEFFRMSN
ncbi:MAG: hypothetical protein FWG18_03495, partial [Alphaproteobacteria bacterium]|nr:hypothetical protein [Alphaproteobacteria bacterium]